MQCSADEARALPWSIWTHRNHNPPIPQPTSGRLLRPSPTGILAFMDTQVPIMAACQVPAVVPKAAASKEAGQSGSAAPVAQTA